MGKRNMCMWAEPGARKTHTLQSSKPHSGGEREEKTGEKETSIRSGVSKSVIYLQQTLMPNNMNIDNNAYL